MTTKTNKLFISYSWSDPDHETWVLNLAKELVENGIDVKIDKWDCAPGHDVIAFMESMITDEEVKKILMICDKVYVQKANEREGGVGMEAQILTPELYRKTQQDKIVAIIKERDENGRPYLPTFYTGRIFIDLSDVEKYSENFDNLVRWAYDKKVYEKPIIGKPPKFIENESIIINTLSNELFSRTCDTIKYKRPDIAYQVEEFFDLCIKDIDDHTKADAAKTEDFILGKISDFLGYRNQIIEIIIHLHRYTDAEFQNKQIHQFFEKALNLYLNEKIGRNSYDSEDIGFILHELYLYALAISLKYEKFDYFRYMTENDFYCPLNDGTESMKRFSRFHDHLYSIENNNNRNTKRKLSPRGYLLKERNANTNIKFDLIMTADLICYLKDQKIEKNYNAWWPETLIYASNSLNSFEHFARSKSHTYFEKFKVALGINSRIDFEQLVIRTSNSERRPRWPMNEPDLIKLTNLKNLDTAF